MKANIPSTKECKKFLATCCRNEIIKRGGTVSSCTKLQIVWIPSLENVYNRVLIQAINTYCRRKTIPIFIPYPEKDKIQKRWCLICFTPNSLTKTLFWDGKPTRLICCHWIEWFCFSIYWDFLAGHRRVRGKLRKSASGRPRHQNI